MQRNAVKNCALQQHNANEKLTINMSLTLAPNMYECFHIEYYLANTLVKPTKCVNNIRP